MKKATKRKNPVSKASDWHKKIAESRKKNTSWKKNLAKGRLQAALNPSILRRARLEKGLPQEALAKKLGVSESTFGAIELGKRMVKLPAAKVLASALGKSIEKLFIAAKVPDKYLANF